MPTQVQALHREDATSLDVLHILLLLQGAMALLTGLGMLLFMGGSPAAWPITLGTPVLLFVLAARVVRGGRWARRIALAVQVLMLLNFALSATLGLIPQVDFSLNLVTIMTNVALPVGLIAMLRRAGAEATAARVPVVAEAPSEMWVAA